MMYVLHLDRDPERRSMTRIAQPGRSVVISTTLRLVEMNFVPDARLIDLVLTEGFEMSRADRLYLLRDVRDDVPVVRIDKA